jgi:ribokinase
MIVVVGSINMDLVVQVDTFPQPGETRLGSDYAQHPGGKGANQAVAAARAGGSVTMIGRVGDDGFGQLLKAGLERDGIDTRQVAMLEHTPSGVAFISVNAEAQNCIIVAPGANAKLTPDDLSAAHFEGAKAVLLQLEIPLSTALKAAQLGRAAGAMVILNLAPAQQLTQAQLADIDLLVVNESEAALLSGLSDEQVALAQLATLVPQVVLTRGERGALWHDGARSGNVPAFKVTTIDTTAAGDAFVGALAVSRCEGRPLAEAVRFAAAAGALATTQRGAQPSLPHRSAIAALCAS